MKLERDRMVDEQLIARGIRDERVLEAMRAIPREHFVPDHIRAAAYQDRALPLTDGQTISQPLMVALTLELACLHPDSRVLDIGTGSGYQAAICAHIAREVTSIEVVPRLAERATERLREYQNLKIVLGDGSLGWPAGAPYDAIVCAAAAPAFPASWREQLAIGGRAVVPIGSRNFQRLTVVVRVDEERFTQTLHESCVYVPLLGAEGW